MILALILLLANADPATAGIPELDVKICQMMVQHQPASDVEYQPGKDVHDKPVVEADLNPPTVQLPEVMSFDVTVDIARYLGLAAPAGMEGKMKIGTLEIHPSGKMMFNGKALEGDAEAALRELCQQKPTLQKIHVNEYSE